MAADSCIVSNSDIAAAEYAADARRDRTAPSLPSEQAQTASARRKRRDGDAESEWARELLGRCTAAAGMTGGEHRSPDHRDDVAAELVARYCDTAGMVRTLPSMSKLCGDALNLYRTIDRHCADLDAVKLAEHADRAAAPTFLVEQAAETRSIAAIAAEDGAQMAGKLARKLGFKAGSMPDAPVWSALYRIVRSGAPDSTLAAERGCSVAAFTRRADRGAAEIRAVYPATDLLRALGLGTGVAAHRPGLTACPALRDARYLVGGDDFTREIGPRTRCMAEPAEKARERALRDAPAPDVTERATDPAYGPHLDRTRPETKRAAFKWARSEYRARMFSVGQGAAVAAEQDRAPRKGAERSALAAALGRN